MGNTAEELFEEGRDLGRKEGKETGLCQAAYALRNLRAEGASIADACLRLDAMAGMDTPTGPASEAVPAAVTETLANIRAVTGKGSTSGAPGDMGDRVAALMTGDDMGEQVVSIMQAKRAGVYQPPVEQAEQLSSREIAARTVEIMKAKRSGNL